jgi:hypothetical protein
MNHMSREDDPNGWAATVLRAVVRAPVGRADVPSIVGDRRRFVGVS